jgi:DTW domain-containing protein
MCLCARIPRIQNQTGVFVLQHPRERLHHIGTARFARLGLGNAQVHIAWNAGATEREPPTWLPEGAALLYPSADAQDLAALPSHARPRHLLVLDGTWHTARTLYRDKLWLRDLPHYRFSPASPSRYRLRREPQHDYVSTIEAIVEALRVLEPETRGWEALLAAFDAMIDDQLAHIGKQTGTPRLRVRRPLAERRTPRALVDEIDRLVVAYVESWRADLGAARELVHVAAVALGTGAVFERVLLPRAGLPTPAFLAHMGLTEADFATSPSSADSRASDEAFRADFAAFLAAQSATLRLAAWNQSTLDLIARATGFQRSQLSLKAAYRAVHGAAARDLEAVIAQLELSPVSLPLRGRAGQRLPRAVAVARYLHARATAARD